MNKKQYKALLKDYPAALTVTETAEILRVSTKTTYRLIRSGLLSAVKIGRSYRIAKPVIIDYLRSSGE